MRGGGRRFFPSLRMDTNPNPHPLIAKAGWRSPGGDLVLGRNWAKRGACLPPILPSSVKTASRARKRQREWSANARLPYRHTGMGASLENVVELAGSSWGPGNSAG